MSEHSTIRLQVSMTGAWQNTTPAMAAGVPDHVSAPEAAAALPRLAMRERKGILTLHEQAIQ